MFLSDDLGDTWHPLDIKEKWPLPYARGIAVKPDDPGVLLRRMRGDHDWREEDMVLAHHGLRAYVGRFCLCPLQTNATVWGLATHPADANRIVAFSLFGEVYVSEDAGASWCKIAREFGEIRTAVWLPN